MSNNPLWLTLATAAAVGAAVWTSMSDDARSGSANAVGMDPNASRMAGQVIGMLQHQGIPAQHGPNGSIELGTDDEGAANQAFGVAERVLLSTGYRPQVAKSPNGFALVIAKGPPAPASADRPLATA
jgi:hypothetical protein